MNRRIFLKSGALSLVTLGLSPSFLRRTALGMELPRTALLQALFFAFISHFVYSLMDLVGHHYTGHHMRRREVMQVGASEAQPA